MNKLDKQFEELMKGVSIDSPSKGFSMKVMERIRAEAVVQKHSLLEDYQPVISQRTWIILIAAFVLLVVYVIMAGTNTSEIKEPGFWTTVTGALQKIDTKPVSNIWQSITGLFASIPLMAYLILSASLALWTLDIFFTRIRQSTSKVQLS